MAHKGELVSEEAEIIPLVEWCNGVLSGYYNPIQGSGCWVKDGRYLTDMIYDNVFGDPMEGADAVAWFAK